jgi:hypothetical protein
MMDVYEQVANRLIDHIRDSNVETGMFVICFNPDEVRTLLAALASPRCTLLPSYSLLPFVNILWE